MRFSQPVAQSQDPREPPKLPSGIRPLARLQVNVLHQVQLRAWQGAHVHEATCQFWPTSIAPQFFQWSRKLAHMQHVFIRAHWDMDTPSDELGVRSHRERYVRVSAQRTSRQGSWHRARGGGVACGNCTSQCEEQDAPLLQGEAHSLVKCVYSQVENRSHEHFLDTRGGPWRCPAVEHKSHLKTHPLGNDQTQCNADFSFFFRQMPGSCKS